jgi:YidC/Oxa1 family membrane protein insertase
MFANIFTTVIIQPIFNLLVLIYALLPGHNFGLAIIIFTILVRLAMWPLVKKQLNHAKAMRELAPELKKIKEAGKGDKQKVSAMTMELYKEREINPFASLGIVLVQLPILLGLYAGLNKIIRNPHQIVSFSYPVIQHMAWIQTLSHNIHLFDNTLLGVVDLTRTTLGTHGLYVAGLLIAAASSLAQYFQSKQLMPQAADARGLRAILKDAGKGKSADQTEVNAAVGRSTMLLVPAMVFVFAIRLALALPLYWLTSSTVAYIQQYRVLKQDANEADASVLTPGKLKVSRKTITSEVVAQTSAPKPKTAGKKASRNKRKRR